jgi:acetyl esterase
MPLDAARRVNDEEAAVMFGPVESIRSVADRRLPRPGGEIRVRVYRPAEGGRLPVLVYFHGGGWVVGSLDSHDGVARFLANHAGCVVVSVDYRLAPEHKFPAAVEDAWSATTWVRDHATEIGVDPARLAVGGDSSGGNLAAVVTRHARDRGLEIGFQLLVYPPLDCVQSAGDDESGWWVRQYLRSESDGFDPDASPLRAGDLQGVAPSLLLSCELDPLRMQGEAYVRRLLEAGVRAEHVCYEGLLHGAYRMPAVLPGAREMLRASADALRKAFRPAA